MTAMEIYDTIDLEQKNAMDSMEKANTSVNEYEEKLKKTHDRKKTSGVSKFVRLTVTQQKCLLLLCVMTGIFVSVASLCVTILEKVWPGAVDSSSEFCDMGEYKTEDFVFQTAEAVDGSWSGWAHWEACSTTCDVGMQIRQRNCSNPAPSGNGRQCLGSYSEKRLCFSRPCSISEQTQPPMEPTAPLPCCETTRDPMSTVTSLELDNEYSGNYGYGDSLNNALSPVYCRPCGNVNDIDDNGVYFDHSGDLDGE